MARDRAVFVRLRASVAELTGPFKEAAKAVRDVGDEAERTQSRTRGSLSGMAQHIRDNKDAWNDVGGALTTYGAAVTGLSGLVLATGISYNTLRQRSVAALTTMTGSAEAANAQMDKLDEFASNSPFARDVFIRAQQQLIGFGREAEEVVPILDAIQNAVAATGGSNQDIEELVRIIAQVGAAGKITAEDLNQFGQRGVDAATLIGSQMGKTGQQIREEITSGTLDADAAIAALVDGMDERFGGAAENVKGTMDGAVDRVKAAVRDIGAGFAGILVDPEGGGLLVDGLNQIADTLRAFEDLPGPVKNTVGALAGLSGVASLAAGGFMLLAPRLVETWDALGKMGRPGEIAQGAIRKLGGAAKVAIAGLGAAGLLYTLSAVGREMNDFTLSTEDAENRLRTFQDTLSGRDLLSFDAGSYGGFQSLLDDLADDSWWRPIHGNLADLGDGLGALFGADTRSDFYKYRDDMAAFDEALARMASSSLPDAVENFGRLVDMTDGSNDSILKLLDVMPGYRDHLVGVANDMGIAATDTNLMRIATGELVPVAEEASRAVASIPEGFGELNAELQEAAAEVRGSNADILQSFIDLSQDIGNQEISLDGWWAQIEEQFEAQAAWADNIAKLRGMGMNEAFIQGLLDEGPAGAMRTQQIVNAMTGGEEGHAEWIARGEEYAEAMHGGAQAALDGSDPVTLKAEVDALETRQELESIFYQDPTEVPVDADPEPMKQTISDTLLWALEQNGIVTFDADGTLAEVRLQEWNATAAETTGMPTLDADPEKARQQLSEYLGRASNTEGVAILDANAAQADAATAAWKWLADNTWGTAGLDVDTSSAYGGLYAFLNAIPSSVSVSIRAIPIVGGLMGRFPGFDTGGYTGPGNRLDVAGLVHADEFVHKKSHVSQPGMLQFHTDLWKTDDLDGAYTRHKLRGYADGGPVGRAAPAMSGGSVRVDVDYDRLAAAMTRVNLHATAQVEYREVAHANRRGEASFGAPGRWSGAPRLGRS